MSIRFKTVLIFISGAILAAGFMFLYWIPSAERESSSRLIMSTHQEMKTISEMLISPLLKKQYASIHEGMDSIHAAHPHWVSIKIHDENNRRIYPITEPTGVSEAGMETHLHPIELRDRTLGSISLVMDLAPQLAEMRAQNVKLASFMLAGFIAILIILVVLLDVSVSRPVRELSAAAHLLKEGDFDAALPAAGEDEVGELIRAFEAMRTSLADQQKVLEIAHTELRESEGRFKDFGESAADWYWEMDKNLRFSYFSDRFFDVAAVDPALLIGKTREETGIPNIDQETWVRHLDDLRNHRPFRNFTHPRNRENGDVVWLSINGKPTFDPDGHFRGYRGTGTDITEMVSAREKLHEAVVEAEKANAAKSDFLASMSHELRTPLNGILGFTQLLQIDTETPLTNDQKESTDQIIKSGNHLLELIDQVLELAKIESNKLSLSIESVGLQDLLNECLPVIEVMASKRNIEVISNIEDMPDVHVLADRTRLRQVLLNLLSNAVKYNNENGTITVNAKLADGDMCCVDVADTGPGIPIEQHGSVFTAFERLGHESSEVEGTGIGLTITRELMHLMNGDVNFSSEVGVGSNFWIDIPLAETSGDAVSHEIEGSMQATGSRSIGASSKDYHLLYVEDNPSNVRLMEKIVSMIPNLHLTTSHTAELGIETAEQTTPDLIVMDINLPGLNGIQALEKLKGMEKTKDIPVIALSASAMPHEVNKGIEAGFLAYLTKPIQVDLFLDTVNNFIKEGAKPT